MLDRSEVGSRGYLKENFRLFHLKDSRAQKLEYHYHEFDKIIFLLSGHVTYTMEGKAYSLQPGDVLLVPHHMIHLPLIDSAEPYERIILWLNGEYLRRSSGQQSLTGCFELARERSFYVLRFPRDGWQRCRDLLEQIERAQSEEAFGHALLADTLFLQLLIAVNRESLAERPAAERGVCRSDPKIDEVIRYIPGHLQEELTVELLAARFYMSRYYLMHRFKEVSGTTIHRYISQKRLLHADELIRDGMPVLKAAEQAGFRDYSTFLRTYRAAFGVSPKQSR